MNVESQVVKFRGGSTTGVADHEGSREWLRNLFESHRDSVFRFALSRMDRDSAMEIVAETFAEAASSQSSFNPQRGTEVVWLLGIAANRIGRWHRTESRYVGLPDAHLASIGDEDLNLLRLPERIDDQRRSIEVQKAVDELPVGERTAFLLHAVEGLSNTEAAEALGISTVAAKLRIFRARKRLQKSLGKHLNEKDAR